MSSSHLSTEIAEQPRAVGRVLSEGAGAIARAADAARDAAVESVLIAARGSSDNAARYAQHVLGRFCALPVSLASPSLYTLYDAPPRLTRTLAIGISQSGQSPDICAVIANAREQGQPTIAITNDTGSPLAQAAELTVALSAGPERSVAATKSYTTSLAVMAALAAQLARSEQLSEELAEVSAAMADQVGAPLGEAETFLADVDRCAVAGRGPNFATAFEGALKITELTGVLAEPHSSADLMHGPVAALGAGAPLIAVAPAGPACAGTLAAVDSALSRGARCLVLSNESTELPSGAALLALAETPEWLTPLVGVIPLQRLALATAGARAVDVDRPFELRKVTRTR